MAPRPGDRHPPVPRRAGRRPVRRRQGAAALELANDYTDFIEVARRRKPPTPAAEIQQNLFPPRIARIAGAQLAGVLLPTYDGTEHDLEGALSIMHETVRRLGNPDFYVTALVARWRAATATFAWVACGHPPPYLVDSDGNLNELDAPQHGAPPRRAPGRVRAIWRCASGRG